ncbi:hypothetical protein EPD60_05135 [Flaviaesturariibacter flavus]|uniref:Uncharacterized protein n=1 Tax=Flaviaesturariibacter flavus TaxID=2502780 RepID=A0A4R1BJV7_9BACT|nr:hypothetical protein [Flaviaesturariibacter flavus]TCJ17579.1 hypothetical protein EPD60_05135 [Flaviaesturariibacter flavus]
MKKALAIFVLLAYFTVSTGFVVNLHYCMDRFHSWELGADARERCDTCGMKLALKKNKCCHDEFKVVKVQQDVTAAKYSVYAFSVPAMAPSFASLYLVPETVPLARPAAPAHGPPLLISRQDTYLRNGVFRI